YYLGWLTALAGRQQLAKAYFQSASSLPPDFAFPNKLEDVLTFQKAIELNPTDAKALYYLGNFWFDKRQYEEAIECWEQSVRIADHFPTVHRNLSLAYYNKRNDAGK